MLNLHDLFHRSSLRARVLGSLSLVLIISFCMIAALSAKLAGEQLQRSVEKKAAQEVVVLVQSVLEPAILGDLPAIEQFLQTRASQHDVLWLHYRSDALHPIHATNGQHPPVRPEWFAQLLGTYPVIASHAVEAGGRVYGHLSLQFASSPDEDHVWNVMWRALASFAVVLLLTGWLIASILRYNLKGLLALRDMAKRFHEGDFKARAEIHPESPPEIRETAAVLNQSAGRIEELMNEMRLMAYHDPLTGLPNRRALEGRLSRALTMARETKSRHVFFYIDLDQFKLINDLCGHAAGDLLLTQLPTSLNSILPENAYLGRLGGDEFGLLLFDQSPHQAGALAGELIKAIQNYVFSYEGRQYHIGASIGIAAITHTSRNEGEVLSHADMACYAAKQAGRGRYHIYEAAESVYQKLQEEMDWVTWFGKALSSKRLVLFRQRIDPISGKEEAPHYEVLLRIRRYPGVQESPTEFLAAAERFGLSPTVDRWVIRTMCAWLANHPRDLNVYSINLSGLSLDDSYFLDFVLETLDAHQLEGRRLAFEITETAAVRNLDRARQFIEGLQSRGCTFYLDDFGKGMASFSYLKQLPADYLKIDGSFVLEMLRDPTDYAIVNAFNQIAHDLSRKSVAECVENHYLLDKLRDIGVDYVQGHAVHMPEPLPE